ncbi:hypothetical protein FIU87_14040 [Bacillus sp. THAF10]|uniref:cytoplasmic protein n=1 Tax=Bacillus sp. THAF10 TaxID=2587848 RepID=UPI00126797B8|nr:cytoplasmic protein [Bacillus sp. THAF10]QFT89779.1 hypothetical protein FIU87_14040 [Bacillus sp. THAF10]
MENKIIMAHQYSSHHRKTMEFSNLCGCFFCTEIYHPSAIEEWIDNGQTALCPKCGIDAVIAESVEFPISEEFLIKMKEYWF